MSEQSVGKTTRVRRVRHRGRGSQVSIYLGKQFRFFINESDWKVLPMAAIIAALVGMVIRKKFFINMEGGLIGSFALTCVAIWNGCFNSIQAVCRERAIIKREHRSGMHVSSYVTAHMIYQLFLCTAQTALTMYVLKLMNVQFPARGFMTSWMVLDIGITMLLVSYASDMMSLLISSVAHTTTGAMTIMPFILIFQLVFSGGIIPLPAWSQSLSNFTISNYGIKAIASQSGYNELPMVTAWNTLDGMRDNEVGGTFTLGQVMDLMNSKALKKYRDKEILKSYTVGEAAAVLSDADQVLHLRGKEIVGEMTLRELIDKVLTGDTFRGLRETVVWNGLPGGDPVTVEFLLKQFVASKGADALLDTRVVSSVTLGKVLDTLKVEEVVEQNSDRMLNKPVTLGEVIDFANGNEALQAQRDRTFTLKCTVGDLIDMLGRDRVRDMVQRKTAEAARKPEYDRTVDNVVENWIMLFLFILVFAFLATLALELIDKDKR